MNHGPLNLPIQHIAYTCTDIREAVAFWTKELKAGPFFLLDNITFERAEYEGGPVKYEHSAAFGQWGDIAVELQQLHRIEPSGFREKIDRNLNHIAYVSADAERDSAELERKGMPMYFEGLFEEVHVRFHDVPLLGHAIELHQESGPVNEAFAQLVEAAEGWDGSDPLRMDWSES